MESQSQSQRPPHHAKRSRSHFITHGISQKRLRAHLWPLSAGLKSQPPSLHNLHLPDQSQHILGTRTQLRNLSTPTHQGCQSRLGRLDPTEASSEPNLSATWLGHAVHRGRRAVQPVVTHHFSELPLRVSAYHSWPISRSASRLVRPSFQRRRPFAMTEHPTSPVSSLHSRRTTRFSICGVLL